MQTLSLGFFEKSQTGKLMSNITNDVASLDQLIGGSFVTVLQDASRWSASMVIIFYHQLAARRSSRSPSIPIYILNYLTFIGRIKRTSHEAREQRDVMYGDLQEKLAGVQVVKSYAKERFEVRQFVGETRSILGLNVRLSDAQHRPLDPRRVHRRGIGTALLLWYGGRLVMHGRPDAGLAHGLLRLYRRLSLRPDAAPDPDQRPDRPHQRRALAHLSRRSTPNPTSPTSPTPTAAPHSRATCSTRTSGSNTSRASRSSKA